MVLGPRLSFIKSSDSRAVGGASVLDYQALFQESIQQETLLEKCLDVSFQTAGAPLAHRLKTHPPVAGCSYIQRILIQSQLSNWIVFIYSFQFFFSLDLSIRAGLRQPTDCKRPFHSSFIDCKNPSLILSLELMHSCICTAEKWIPGSKKVMMACINYKYRTFEAMLLSKYWHFLDKCPGNVALW